ncbi:MAG: hypothetical protein BGO77_05125 [Caedibacter sp. 37-49]|nr:MAG: hypothetical protein BGO77_05125 [Caedibacter sp. 37-49]
MLYFNIFTIVALALFNYTSANALNLFSSSKDRLKALVAAHEQSQGIDSLNLKIRASQNEKLQPAASDYNKIKKDYDQQVFLLKQKQQELRKYIELEINRLKSEIEKKNNLILEAEKAIKANREKVAGKDVILNLLAGKTNVGSEAKNLVSMGAKYLWERLGTTINSYLAGIGLPKPFNEYKTAEEMIADWHASLAKEKEELQKAILFNSQLEKNPKLAEYLTEQLNKGIKGWFTGSQKQENERQVKQKIQEIVELRKNVSEHHVQLSNAIGQIGISATDIIRTYSDQAKVLTDKTLSSIKKADCKKLKGLNDLRNDTLKSCMLDELQKVGFKKVSNLGQCYQLRITTQIGKDAKSTTITEKFDLNQPYEKVLACAKAYTTQ